MKRILCAFIAAALVMFAVMPVFAASSKVTVKTNTSSKSVSYTYDSDDNPENVKSIKSLMTKAGEVTKSKMRTQTLTITSSSANAEPVSFSLRISIPDTVRNPSSEYYKALDYYKLKVNAENGTPLYNYENDTTVPDDEADYRDVPLGVLNTSKANESATYNVTLTANPEISNSSVISTAKKLDWSIVSEPYKEPKETATPEPQESESPAETALPDASPSVSPALPTITPAPTAKVKSDKNGNYTLEKGEYSVGTDIDPDRYTLTGSGLVNIYNSDGALDRTVALKNKTDKTSRGVNEYILDLSKGQSLEVSEQAELSPYVAPTASPTPSPTSKASSATTSSSSSSASASKTNPKTGDNTPIGIISVLGISALVCALLIAGVKKNK